jgi:hypothetical protein
MVIKKKGFLSHSAQRTIRDLSMVHGPSMVRGVALRINRLTCQITTHPKMNV